MVNPPLLGPIVKAFLPPVPLFAPPPSTTFSTGPGKLKTALDAAVKAVADGRRVAVADYEIAISVVDLLTAAPGATALPMAGHRQTQHDYIASAGKVAVLYAAFVLRDMVRRFAAATGVGATELFTSLDIRMTPAIVRNVPRLAVDVRFLKPNYAKVFRARGLGSGLDIQFRPEYETALDGMIIGGENAPTQTCVQGIGYSYLNGALAAHGFFDGTRGLWIATDYNKGYSKVKIETNNAGKSEAAAATSEAFARLLSVIIVSGVLSDIDCREMRRRLHGAVRANGGRDRSWITRPDVQDFIPDAALTHNKIGYGTITEGKLAGKIINAELLAVDAARIPGLAASKKYAIAYQNVLDPQLPDIAFIVRQTISGYEH